MFGYISDSLPILKHRRIPYFIFYAFIVAAIFITYPFVVHDYKTALIMGVILNTAQCGAQIMIDTLVVERVHAETDDAGRGQSLAMASKTAGTVAATILSLILMLVRAPHVAFPVGRVPYPLQVGVCAGGCPLHWRCDRRLQNPRSLRDQIRSDFSLA